MFEVSLEISNTLFFWYVNCVKLDVLLTHLGLARKITYHLDLIFSNILYGVNFSYFVSIVKNWDSFQDILFIQIVTAAIFFIPFSIASYRHRFSWGEIGRVVVVSIIVTYGSMYTLLWGAKYTNPVSASIIATLGPVLTLLVSRIVSRTEIKTTARKVGIVLGLIGAVILLVDHRGIIVYGSQASGNFLVLVSVFCLAIQTIIIKPVLNRHGTVVVVGFYYFIGVIITAPFFAKSALSANYMDMSILMQFEMLYILIFGTIIPSYLLYRGTEKLTSIHTALYRYIQPIMTIIIATIRGQANFDGADLISAIFIFAGVLLTASVYIPFFHREKRSGEGGL